MNELQLILLLLFLAATAIAALQFKKAGELRTQLDHEKEGLANQNAEMERVRKAKRERTEELERVRKDLQETKAKLKRQKKEAHEAGTKKSRSGDDAPGASHSSAASVVRVSNQEVESAHKKAVQKLEKAIADRDVQIDKKKAEVERLKAAAAKRKAQVEKAAASLSEGEESAVDLDGIPEAQAEQIKEQIAAVTKAAGDRERDLAKKLKSASGRAEANNRRAVNNHSLYLVVKGQLELAEDRLALLLRKYEGAKAPEEFKTTPPARAKPAPPPSEAEKPVQAEAAESPAPETVAEVAEETLKMLEAETTDLKGEESSVDGQEDRSPAEAG